MLCAVRQIFFLWWPGVIIKTKYVPRQICFEVIDASQCSNSHYSSAWEFKMPYGNDHVYANIWHWGLKFTCQWQNRWKFFCMCWVVFLGRNDTWALEPQFAVSDFFYQSRDFQLLDIGWVQCHKKSEFLHLFMLFVSWLIMSRRHWSGCDFSCR